MCSQSFNCTVVLIGLQFLGYTSRSALYAKENDWVSTTLQDVGHVLNFKDKKDRVSVLKVFLIYCTVS